MPRNSRNTALELLHRTRLTRHDSETDPGCFRTAMRLHVAWSNEISATGENRVRRASFSDETDQKPIILMQPSDAGSVRRSHGNTNSSAGNGCRDAPCGTVLEAMNARGFDFVLEIGRWNKPSKDTRLNTPRPDIDL